MIDESKRKKIIYAIIAFIVVIIISFIGFIVLTNKKDLPPVDSETSETSDAETGSSATADDTPEEPSMYKNDIEFKKFEGLSQVAITDSRIDVVLYYLSQYASTQSTGSITAFTLDKRTIKPTEEDERQIFTFTVKDNNDVSYKVELSYIYAADAFVRILDKNNNVIQTSPMDDAE